nr:hypothetical protein L204_01328 [Cryptococcus depauperatus CBS 7855]
MFWTPGDACSRAMPWFYPDKFLDWSGYPRHGYCEYSHSHSMLFDRLFADGTVKSTHRTFLQVEQTHATTLKERRTLDRTLPSLEFHVLRICDGLIAERVQLMFIFIVAGIKCVILEKRSTTTSMASYPFDSFNGPIMSIDISDHGRNGTGNGCRRPDVT